MSASEQLLASDICRCTGFGCKEASECLRCTDRPEGRCSFTNFLKAEGDGKCVYKITLKDYNKATYDC